VPVIFYKLRLKSVVKCTIFRYPEKCRITDILLNVQKLLFAKVLFRGFGLKKY